MKRKITGVILLIFLAGCGCSTLNLNFRKLDTPEKIYQFAQEQWTDALIQYKAFLSLQTPEQQEAFHNKYDQAIKDVDAALDLWGITVLGLSYPDEQKAHKKFLEAKNKLLRLGFARFFKGGDK